MEVAIEKFTNFSKVKHKNVVLPINAIKAITVNYCPITPV
jgi:hypothetical protein